MSLESVNIDILSSIIIYLELSDVRHLILSSSSLSRVICNANFIWRNLLRRDFSILIPHDQPNLIYDIYKDTFKNSYNLYLRTNSPLTWKEYSKDKTITLNVEIGEGLPSKKLPLPPHKILKGYNSVVVHEFILKEKIGKVEKVIMKKAFKVFATKIFDGKYLFSEHKDPSKNDKPYPIQFHFVDNNLYFAYFYNAIVVCPTDEKDIDMYTGYGEAENCIDAFKKNFQRGFLDNPEGKKG
jgi:hypothetical protein